MRNYLMLTLIGLCPFIGFSNTTVKDFKRNYIETYAPFAIQEMKRVGVPASIKLAQGMLESGYGQSKLSRESNNHFGIKCKKNWTGKTYYHKDDDYVDGELIKSCFRGYDNIWESYRDHSDFLKSNQRYLWLFEDLSVKDYKAWAYGLKKSGYATSKTYAEKLIKIIEENGLYVYDYGNVGQVYFQKPQNPAPPMKWQIIEENSTPSIITPVQPQRFSAPQEEVMSAPTYNLNGVNLKLNNQDVEENFQNQDSNSDFFAEPLEPAHSPESKKEEHIIISKPIDMPSDRVKSLKRRPRFRVQSR